MYIKKKKKTQLFMFYILKNCIVTRIKTEWKIEKEKNTDF